MPASAASSQATPRLPPRSLELRLKVAEIAGRFGTSTMPVRQALQDLHAEGLVELLKTGPELSLLKITPTHLTLLNPRLTADEIEGLLKNPAALTQM